MKLNQHLMISFLLLSIIPMLIVGTVAYFISYNTILDNTIGLTTAAVNRATGEMNDTIKNAETLINNIQYEPDLQAVMRRSAQMDTYANRMNTLEINTLLSLIQSYSSPDIFGIYLVGQGSKQYKSNIYSLQYDNLSEAPWYKETISTQKARWFTSHLDSYVVSTPSYHLISYCAPFIDKLTGNCSGVMIVEIKTDRFANAIIDMGSIEVSNYYILDGNDDIIIASNQVPGTEGEAIINDDNTIKYVNKLANGWKVVCTISQRTIVRQALGTLTVFMLIIAVLVVAFSIILSALISRRISTPIKTLMDLMEEITHGNFNVYMEPSNTSYEITKLCQSFNTMAKNEALHVSQIREEQRKLRKAHLAALQAQINPHFLYNCMDTIAWNVRMNEKDKAVAAIMALTKFFRCSLSRGEEIITVQEELEQVSLYLQIQLIRYGDILSYAIEADKKLYPYMLPKLVIQPLVENALYHGLKNKAGGGTIEIDVSEKNHIIVITVTDNGIGMTPKQIISMNDCLVNGKEAIFPEAKSGYGIKNVNERIKIYFGESYGLSYKSEYGKYTKAIIRLPKRRHKQEFNDYYAAED